jgi:hypothetical protein
MASPDGRTLANAGWMWHPIDEVRAFDVETALRDPSHLDGKGFDIDAWAEETGGGFDPDGRLVVALNGIEEDGVDVCATADTPVEIRTFDLHAPSIVRRSGRVGTLMVVWQPPRTWPVRVSQIDRCFDGKCGAGLATYSLRAADH